MADFQRLGNDDILYRDDTDIIPVIIEYTTEQANRYNQTKGGDTCFNDAIMQYEGIHDCIFVNNGTNKSGKSKKCRILLRNTDFSMQVLVNGNMRSFFGPIFNDKGFVVPIDENEFIEHRCNIHFVEQGFDIIEVASEMGWGNKLSELKEFVVGVSNLQRPLREIRKEEDQEIWSSYAEGLDALTKSKQELRRIKSVGTIKTKANTKNKYKSEKIKDIKTIELELDVPSNHEILQTELEDFFDNNYIDTPTFSFNDNKCEISFNDYRVIRESDIAQINELAIQSFYRLDNCILPQYKLSGIIVVRSSEEDNKEIIEQFDKILSNYDSNYPIKERYTYHFENDDDRNYAIDIINNQYSHILSTKLTTSLEVNFQPDSNNENINCLQKSYHNVAIRDNFILIECNEPLNIEDIENLSFSFDSCRIRIDIEKGIFDNSIQVPASLDIKNDYYQSILVDRNKINVQPTEWLYAITKAYKKQNKSVKLKISYTYAFKRSVDKNLLKSLARSLSNEQNIIIQTALCKAIITPANYDEYEDIKSKIITYTPSGIIVDIPDYRPALELIFNNEDDNYIHNIFNSVINDLSSYSVHWNENQKKLEFMYGFQDESQRDGFKKEIEKVSDNWGGLLLLNYSFPTGQTIIRLHEDNQLKTDQHRKQERNFLRESVKYITREFDEINTDVQLAEDKDEKQKLREHKRDFLFNSPIMGICVKYNDNHIEIELNEDFIHKLEDKDISLESGNYIQFQIIGEASEVKRKKDAMNRLLQLNSKYDNFSLANPNITDFLFDPRYAREIESDIKEIMESVRQSQIETTMNDKQIEAVARAIEAKDIAFIQGPPGTGKTTVIAEIIWQEVLRNPQCRILLTSQTNIAVDNALERLQGKRGIRPIRITKTYGDDNSDAYGKRYTSVQMEDWVKKPTTENNDNAVNLWIDIILQQMDDSEKYASVLAKWRKDLSQKDDFIRDAFSKAYLSNVNLIASTCSICGSKNFNELYKYLYGDNSNPKFDVVIMDEASKATPLEMAIPLVYGRKIILIGDHKQLPPMLNDEEFISSLSKIGRTDLLEKLKNIKESQFKRLFEVSQKYRSSLVATLEVQYRMHEQIMKCISHFYKDDIEGGLRCGITEDMDNPDFNIKGSRYHGLNNNPFLTPDVHAIWVNVDGEEEKVGNSQINKAELKAIKTVLNSLRTSDGYDAYLSHFNKQEDREIGIITFYGAQAKELNKMRKNGELGKDIRVDAVDRFQGMERNIVIVSTVRTNNIGFAKDIERINVAFSRAKRLLIVIGKRDFFYRNPNYKASIKDMLKIDIKQLN